MNWLIVYCRNIYLEEGGTHKKGGCEKVRESNRAVALEMGNGQRLDRF